jgi:hypothetical protein
MRYALLLLMLLPVASYGYEVEVEVGLDAGAALRAGAGTGERTPGCAVEVRSLPPGYCLAGYDIESENWTAVEDTGVDAADGPSSDGALSGFAGEPVQVRAGTLFGYNILVVSVETRRVREGIGEQLESMRIRADLVPRDGGLTVRRRSALCHRSIESAVSGVLGIEPSGATWDIVESGDPVTERPGLDGGPVDCVIITGDSLGVEFERLAEWHDLMGIKTVVRTVDWIEDEYAGADTPERIRNFLRDAYQNWGTVYALMGGDPDVVPMRILNYDWLWDYTDGTSDRIAVDAYYSNLDGNWNADGDGSPGEGGGFADEDDLDTYADICVGRAPVSTVEDARSFVNKTIDYARGGKPGDWYNRAVFMAQIVFENPEFDGAEFAEAILEHFPSNYDKIKLYEKYQSYPGSIEETLENCTYYMNQGAGIVSHIGHGDFFRLNLGGEMMWRWQADSLDNDSCYFFMYMMNCASANPHVESIAKNFIRNPKGGAVALMGNQIFASPRNGLDLEADFFELLFSSENLTLGVVSTIPRHLYAVPERNYPWWTYLNNILYGDPCIRLWEGTPDVLEVTGAATMDIGDTSYSVAVTDGGAGVEGAVVVLSGGRGEYAAGVTDGSGRAVIPFRPRGPGDVSLVVSRDGYLPAESGLEVTGAGGRLYVSGVSIDDAGGSYSGNGDGEAGWGERVGIGVGLTNGGTGTVSPVTAEVRPVEGCSLSVDVEFEGPSVDPPVYLGRNCSHPASSPFRVRVGEELLGRSARDFGEEDGCWIWLDSRGWHFRMNGDGVDGFAYRCSVAVFGEVKGHSVEDLESGDALTAGDGYFIFDGEISPDEFEDGFDFQSGYGGSVLAHSGAEEYGAVGPGEVIRYYDYEFVGGPGDRLTVWFESVISSGSGGEWHDWFPVVVRQGMPVVDRFSGFSSHPYKFTIGVRNAGGGAVKDLEGTARAIQDIVLVDSISTYGDLAGGERAAGDEFTFSGSPDDAVIEIELRDAYGRTWKDTLYERQVAVPGAPGYEAGPDWVELTWEPAEGGLLRGYEVYRADDPDGDLEFIALVEGQSRFVDTGLTPEEDYYYEVRAVDVMGNGSDNSDAVRIWTGAPYQEGFPVEIRGAAWSSPVAGDANHDGLKEIFVGSRGQDMAAVDVNGDMIYGFPYTCTCEVRSSPALADLDGDGTLECVFGIGMDVVGGPACKQLLAFNHDGTYVSAENNPRLPAGAPGWPQPVGNLIRSAPAIYDLDDDGYPEIVVGAYGKVSGHGPVYAFRYDGSPYLEGSPVFGQCDDVIWTAPAVADLNGDGRPEVVVTDISGGIYIWKWDGGAYLPDSTFLVADSPAAFRASPAVGDTDGDGHPEIVSVNVWGQVYAFNHDGSPVDGADGMIASIGGECWSDPSLADFDGDGALEIVFGLGAEPGKLVVLKGDGSAYGASPAVFTAPRSLAQTSPAIADLDDDGELEIVICSQNGYVYAVNTDGTAARGFPRRIEGAIYASPLIDDLDMDGDMELVVAGYDSRLHVWDLGAPYSADAVPWGMYHHDSWHTGNAAFEAPGDTLAPRYTLGIFQGTVVDRVLEIFVAPSEYIQGPLEIEIGGPGGRQALAVESVPNSVRTFRAHYMTEATSAETVFVSSTDLHGNRGTGERIITYSEMLDGEWVATSFDGLLEARPDTPAGSAAIGILPVDSAYLPSGGGGTPVSGPAYNVCTFGGPGTRLSISARAKPSEALYVHDGSWIQAEGQLREGGLVSLPDATPGVYAIGARSESPEQALGMKLIGPNPFAGECRISLSGSAHVKVRVNVFDVRGRLVAALYEGLLGSSGDLAWDGRDRNGRVVSSGIYFVRAESSSAALSRKVIYVR